MKIRGKEITSSVLEALIRLCAECQCVANEQGPGFEEKNPSFMDALKGAQDVIGNVFTTGKV